MAGHGTVLWNELNTHNVEAAKTFYAATLGWTYDAMPMPNGTYWIIKTGDAVAGGMFAMDDPALKSVPEHWLAYVEVDDVDGRVSKLKTAGGQVMRDAFDIPNVGRIAIVKDKNGAVLGLMKPSPRQQ